MPQPRLHERMVDHICLAAYVFAYVQRTSVAGDIVTASIFEPSPAEAESEWREASNCLRQWEHLFQQHFHESRLVIFARTAFRDFLDRKRLESDEAALTALENVKTDLLHRIWSSGVR